ncbi:hypothetical protein PIB30_017914 [Stylosanthes scabra]|uniref:Aminotransferase-like plant mobile domain-containing protein n=1 Tax=Stylosanthes scabra TaxID=79078 RepID=A0ABU6Q8H9_9FABA|nr:hypothetical protein [Stylosanthes scabra]
MHTHQQHLLDFVKLKDRFYPDLVAIANTTLSIVNDEEKPSSFTMIFHLGTTKYELSVGDFCTLGQLNFSGTLFKHGDNPPPEWNFVRLKACQFFKLNPNCGNKMPTKPMSDEYRLLHYLMVWVILLRNNNHGVVMDDDLPILWALVKDLEINWSYFISQHMKRLQEGQISLGLGYVILWTKIFKLFNVDLTNIMEKTLKDTNCINIGTLHKMGRVNIGYEAQVQGDQPQPQAQEAQAIPQEHIGSSYDAPQPSMFNLLQVLQRIEQNQVSMNHRLQRIERHLNSNEDED